MKKFLSLLLALTLVLSLVVVPARADSPDPTAISVGSTATVTRGSNTTITATAPTSALNNSSQPKTYTELTNDGYTKGAETWSWSTSSSNVTLTNTDRATVTVAGAAAGTATLTCNYSTTFTKAANSKSGVAADTINVSKSATVTVTVNDAALAKDISYIVFNGRNYPVANGQTATVYYVSGELTSSATWSVLASGSYTASIKDTFTKPTSGVSVAVPVTVKSSTDNTVTTDANITVTLSEVAAPTYNITSPAANACVAGQDVVFTVSAPNSLPTGASYVWTCKLKTASSNPAPLTGTQSGQSFTFKAPSSAGDYDIFCAINLGSNATTAAGTGITIKVSEDKLRAEVTAPTAASKQLNGSSVPYSFSFKDYTNSSSPTNINLSSTDITWTATGGGATFTQRIVKGSNGTAANTLTLGNTAGNVTVTATFTYLGKNYTVTFPTITNVVPTYTLGSTYCGYNNSVYRANELVSYANSALSAAGITGVTVGSVALASASGNVVTATGTKDTGYTLAASPTYLGTADLTATVTKTGGGTFKMTFKVPVLPIPYSTSLGTVNAEPYTTGSTYYNNTYRVTLPTTFNQYYVVSKNTTPNYNVSAAPASGVTTVTLNQNDFVNGQCTLYVIAWNSNYNGYGYGYNYGKYYSGAITVTQTNYNIQYNGVAGETVQFAQSDFTDFMNEVAEARGDASKTKSYPYVTFDYVTFSLPTTAQGTLYYGGTAMSTSNSSGAFNTRTKVTNLDSVTFVPNAKTTAKTITLNFTLYATRYSSSSTSRGTTVSYSGSVVVNLVREDIKYTVSQGDSVRFDESDFLSYLRSTKGYSSNYTIDYVTFDQSAVSAVNEGSLYTYYNGYNYGGSIKTTDKFYYNAAASQNALSDVAFLASRYAKTGETVYIPFTIYARYGTTGTGTRQLTGTVAIKIGQTMNFIDVKTTDYFYNSVKWAVGKNITNGTSSTTFSPYKSCTRAEIVTFLWRAAGSPEPTITRNPFRDVNAVTHSSYYKAILWASQKGITSGTSATAFSPDQVCTRAQIVTFLYRYAGQPSGYYSNPFKDVGATSEASYYNAILWAVGKGITTGTSATTFSPYASCNRAEAVTFLYRYTNGL